MFEYVGDRRWEGPGGFYCFPRALQALVLIRHVVFLPGGAFFLRAPPPPRLFCCFAGDGSGAAPRRGVGEGARNVLGAL